MASSINLHSQDDHTPPPWIVNPSSSDEDSCSNAVWSKPSNGVSPVMGAVSWPALGDSTKPSPKSDGSLQVTGNSSPSLHRPASANNMNSTSTTKRVPSGQRSSMERDLGANGGVPTAQKDLILEKPMESNPRDHAQKESQRGSNSGIENNHNHQRNPYRRGNGAYHHNYGGKPEWNQHRNFNNMHPQRGFRRGVHIRPSVHTSAPFVPPPMPVPLHPFGNNFMYPDMASTMIYVQGPPPPESLRSMPLVAPIPTPTYFTVPGRPLQASLVNQIDYYFSNENLVKDTYLRRNMDEQGWVPVNLIAGFKKVSNLTDDVGLIVDAMRSSSVVEVQGDKMRRRNGWTKWLMPAPNNNNTLAS